MIELSCWTVTDSVGCCCHQMSLLKTGLLQLSPESVVIGEVTYYDRGLAVVDRVDRESIAEVLGPTSKVLALSVFFFHWTS